ncbi:hypothetical protein [Kutzneria sp. NPDC052558]|uniref:hypothetical protein n=1 Tax=Kutzneria sp. NPDC052558 TaxID=3364121 RepID=UPI0037C621D5
MERVRELAVRLVRECGDDAVVGLSPAEIVEVATALGVYELPSSYVVFLGLMGKRAGQVLAGMDMFYPRLLKVKEYAQELFEEAGKVDLLSDGAIVFALHQGYRAYWFADNSEDPQVFSFKRVMSRRVDTGTRLPPSCSLRPKFGEAGC